jgi:protease PrsW
MNLSHVIIGWLLIMAGILLWNKVRADIKKGSPWWNFGDYNPLIITLILFGIIWVLFSSWSPEPHFSNADEEIAYGKKTNQPWLLTDAYLKKIKEHPENTDYHYALLESYFIQETSNPDPPDQGAYNRQGVQLFNQYTDWSEHTEGDPKHDLGYLFLAHWYLDKPSPDASMASFCLRQIEKPDQKYVNYFMGKMIRYDAGGLAAEPYFLDEIKSNGFKKGAWQQLALLYNENNDAAKLEALTYNDTSCTAVSNWLRFKVYFLKGDLISYYQLKFQTIFSTLSLWGILGAFLVLIVWLFFLKQLSFLSQIRWWHLLLSVSIGIVLCLAAFLLYEFYEHVLEFETNGEIGNDFLYCFLGIGAIEEGVKVIPFLLILRFTSIIRKPIDYLLVAAAASLGFAFFENLVYISIYGLEVIHLRALTACVSHMASGCMVAYGFLLVRYRYPGKWWIIPLAFLLSALGHGFYDFWLINNQVHSFYIFSFIFYLTEILVFVSLLNNALNQSAEESDKDLAFNVSRFASIIAASLIFIFILEYAGSCITYGTSIGGGTLSNSLIFGAYLVFFLSVRLSNISVEPKAWMPIEFFAGLLPSDILIRSRLKNKSTFPETSILLHAMHRGEAIALISPLKGKVIKRLNIRGDDNWFEFESEKAELANGILLQEFYLKPEEEEGEEGETIMKVFARQHDLQPGGKTHLTYLGKAVFKADQ